MPIQSGPNYIPKRIVSPGVFTRELDQTFLAQGVAAIGGVVVAPFKQGPGFSPTIINSQADLTNIFGADDGTLYGIITAQQYLQQQGTVTICRVGGLGGYEQNNELVISAIPGAYSRFVESGSFSGNLLNATYAYTNTTGAFSVTGSLSLLFSSGVYSGSTVVVGNVEFVTDPANTNSTGSTFVSTHITGSIPLFNYTTPAAAFLTHATMSLETVNVCNNELAISGILSGSYGILNPASWTPGAISSDTCGTASLVTGSDEVVLAVLANTALDRGQNLLGFSGSILTPVLTGSVGAEYYLKLNEVYFNTALGQYVSSSYGTYQFSLDPSSTAYITSVFGTDPEAGYYPIASGQKLEAAYTFTNFKNLTTNVLAEMLASGSYKIQLNVRSNAMQFTDGIGPDVGTSAFDLTNAYTPFIRSQTVSTYSGSGGPAPTTYDLFQLFTITDGTYANQLYKIQIANVSSPGSIPGTDYGSFSLIIRAFGDTDAKQVILERYDNLTLDPTDANFVARRLGDQYNYIDFTGKIQTFGDYANVSQLVYVQMATPPYPVSSIPFGFGPYAAPIGGDYAVLGKLPAIQFTSASIYSSNPGRYASGIVFQPAPSNADAELVALYPNGSAVGPELDNVQYFAPVPQGSAVGENVAFDLQAVCGLSPLYVPSEESTNYDMRNFILGFQGGFDGQSPSLPLLVGNDILPTNQQGLDCSTSTSTGSYAYAQCLDALGNADEWDFNLIVTPGINYQDHPFVVTSTIDMVESRGDAFYIMDIAPNQTAGDASIENVVNLAAQLDTNYAGTYYPWVKIANPNTDTIMVVPPSVVMMGVYAANDQSAAEWFAPAGLNRGGIALATQVVDRTTHDERDTLYAGNVNPIAAFPGQGVVAWGQKTLQLQASALDRINVRRLLIAIKKFIASSSRYLNFEQSTAATMLRFLNVVNPYLESVQQRSGIYSFKVIMDGSNNTPDLIDQNILYGQLYIKPTKTSEYVLLDFNVLPTGATFPS